MFRTTSSCFEDKRSRPRTADALSTSAPSATMIFVTTRSLPPPPRAASANGTPHGTGFCRVIAHRQERSTSGRGGEKKNVAHPASPADNPTALKRLGRLGGCNGLDSSRRARGGDISPPFRSPGWQSLKTEPQLFFSRAQDDPSARFPQSDSTHGRPLLQDSVADMKPRDFRGARGQRTRKIAKRKKAAAVFNTESSILSPERAAARMANLRKVYGARSVNLRRARRNAS